MKPKSVNNYEILKLVAVGGMAEVFLARSWSSLTPEGKLVALKRTLPDYLDSPDLCQMFLDEIRVGSCLNHQNIVQVFDFGMVNNQAYLVMEYINGISLRELLSFLRDHNQFIPLPMALYIITKVATALDYAYNAADPNTGDTLKLIHRDISPQNIMLNFEGDVKVIDFGIAKATAVRSHTRHGMVKGKVVYMSPEQVRNEEIDQRTDLFSLGIIFWELLANRRFFAGKTVDEVRRQVREYRVQSLALNETEGLKVMAPFLEKLLHHDRNSRYASAQELARDLQFFLNREFPMYSHIDCAVYLKDLFADKYGKSLQEFAAKPPGQAPPSQKPVLAEKTVLTEKIVQRPTVPLNTYLKKPVTTYTSVPVRPRRPLPMKRVVRSVNGDLSWRNLAMFVLSAGVITYFGVGVVAKFGRLFASSNVEITFFSEPPNARVSIDGQPVDFVSPFTMKMSKNKVYQIEVDKAGYQRKRFTFKPIRKAQYRMALEPLPSPTGPIYRGLSSLESMAENSAKKPPAAKKRDKGNRSAPPKKVKK